VSLQRCPRASCGGQVLDWGDGRRCLLCGRHPDTPARIGTLYRRRVPAHHRERELSFLAVLMRQPPVPVRYSLRAPVATPHEF
jgi:hypothetical protein